MANYILRRLLGLASTLFLVTVVVFFFVHLLPGDPVRLVVGPQADASTIASVRGQLGLEGPILTQFLHYLGRLLRGDLGISLISRQPVVDEIIARFMPTVWLNSLSMAWAVLFGLTGGMASAVWRNRWPDKLNSILGIIGISFPGFALGMLLIQVFAVDAGWFPAVGAQTGLHYVLPSVTLGAGVAAVMARFTRSAFVDVFREEYMDAARAKGLSETLIVLKHGFRNAMIPVVTMMGLQFGFLLGGSIVVEKVFNWPGLGRMLIDAVEMRDYPVIQAEILLFSFAFIFINLGVDVLYALVNPAIRHQ